MCEPISVDVKRFKTETGLEDSDVKELYKGFVVELLEELEKLQVQLSKDDFEKMARTVHNIKGISSSYMADQVFTCSVELGRALSNNNKSDIISPMNRLIEAIQEAADDISRLTRS